MLQWDSQESVSWNYSENGKLQFLHNFSPYRGRLRGRVYSWECHLYTSYLGTDCVYVPLVRHVGRMPPWPVCSSLVGYVLRMNLSYIPGRSFKLMWAKCELLISSLTLEISREIELSLEETHTHRDIVCYRKSQGWLREMRTKDTKPRCVSWKISCFKLSLPP